MRRLPLVLCALASTASADLWVDPPSTMPLEWLEPPPPRYPVTAQEPPPPGGTEEVSTRRHGRPWQEISTPRRMLRQVRIPRPNRIRTVDIWGEWEVPRRSPGLAYAVGGEKRGYGVSGESDPRLPAYCPGVGEDARKAILSLYFARKEFPYFLPSAEFTRRLVETGWPAVEPSIGCLADAGLDEIAWEVLKRVTGKKLPKGLSAWERWFTGGHPGKPPAPPSAASREAFLDAWVRWELSLGHWGADEGFGERLSLYDAVLRPGILTCAGDEDALVRQNAVGWLAGLRDPALAEPLRRALDGADPVSSFRAWRGLMDLSDASVEARAARDLEAKDPLLKVAALHAAGAMGDPKHARALERAMNDPALRSTALAALARLGSKDEARLLRTLALPYRSLGSESRGVRAFEALTASAGLARLGEKAGVEILLEAFREVDAAGRANLFEVASFAAQPGWMGFDRPEAVPQIQAFWVDLAGRCSVPAWQDFLRETAQDAAACEELRGAAVQSLEVRGAGDLELLERLSTSSATPGYARASALLRLWEADADRGRKAARECLSGSAPGNGDPELALDEAIRAFRARAEADADGARRAQTYHLVLPSLDLLDEIVRRKGELGEKSRERRDLEQAARRLRSALRGRLLGGSPEARKAAQEDAQALWTEIRTRPSWAARGGKDPLARRTTAVMLLVQALAAGSEPTPEETAMDAALALLRTGLSEADAREALGVASCPTRSMALRLKALQVLGQPRGIPAARGLAELARSPATPSLVRQGAALALGAQGRKEAFPDLLDLLEEPEDGWVRVAAWASLEGLMGKARFCDWLSGPPGERARCAEAWRRDLQ